jgi:hypothetical protein
VWLFETFIVNHLKQSIYNIFAHFSKMRFLKSLHFSQNLQNTVYMQHKITAENHYIVCLCMSFMRQILKLRYIQPLAASCCFAWQVTQNGQYSL